MKKAIIWILVILSLSSSSFAATGLIMPLQTYDDPTTAQVNTSISNANDTIKNGALSWKGGTHTYNANPSRILHNLTKLGSTGWYEGLRTNRTDCMDLNATDTTSGSYVLFIADNNSTNPTAQPYDMRGQTDGGSISFYDGNHQTTIFPEGVYVRLCIYWNWTENNQLSYNIYKNGALQANSSSKKTNSGYPDLYIFGREATSSGTWDNFTSCNSTSVDLNCSIAKGVSIDTDAPVITSYNLIDEGGCTNWNTDHDNPCSTSDTTPSINFTTNEASYCAMAGGSSNTVLNLNYTQMSSARNCTGAGSGEGNTQHMCTLSTEEFVYDTSYLFISCKDDLSNMNRSGTSTSGPLKVSVTGLESAARSAIGIGVQNALLANYTNYTDQQVYSRNLANSQVRGTFDWFVRKNNKAWAFNRIGVSDSHVNMFNLTPVLYTLELANKTSTNITKQVELLINSTK